MFSHIPVLQREVTELLIPDELRVYFDLTAGGGGHAQLMLDRYPGIRAVLLDRDSDAVDHLRKRFSDNDRVSVVHASASDVEKICFLMKIKRVDIVLADLGVSSHQFDTPERGFSIDRDGPLDMRMNPESPVTARDFIDEISEKGLQDILSRYAQERESKRVAGAMKLAVSEGVDTTFGLRDAISAAKRYGKRTPSYLAKIFMALRMAVNKEVEQLEAMLHGGFRMLAPGGVMGVISFHSVEDRLVKHFFRDRKNRVPLENGFLCSDEVTVSGPVTTEQDEVERNRRSRSAKLRILKKHNR